MRVRAAARGSTQRDTPHVAAIVAATCSASGAVRQPTTERPVVATCVGAGGGGHSRVIPQDARGRVRRRDATHTHLRHDSLSEGNSPARSSPLRRRDAQHGAAQAHQRTGHGTRRTVAGQTRAERRKSPWHDRCERSRFPRLLAGRSHACALATRPVNTAQRTAGAAAAPFAFSLSRQLWSPGRGGGGGAIAVSGLGCRGAWIQSTCTSTQTRRQRAPPRRCNRPQPITVESATPPQRSRTHAFATPAQNRSHRRASAVLAHTKYNTCTRHGGNTARR
jgi:hypothetical protein